MHTSYFLAFVASFAFVFLKAFQQLNVVHDNYLLVVPTSFLMAVCEIYVVYNAAHYGLGWLVVYVGLGGGLGCVTSMWIHKRVTRRG